MPKAKKSGNRDNRINILPPALGALCALIAFAIVLFIPHSSDSGVQNAAIAPTDTPLAVVTITQEPTAQPTEVPTAAPTVAPTTATTETPTTAVTETPTAAPAMAADHTITITAVGDCTLGGDTNGSELEERFADAVEKCGYEYFFAEVRDLFEADDFTIVNLEGPLTDSTQKREGRKFNMRGDAAYAKILSSSSVEVASVANNHALDFQKEGLYDTREAVEAEGVGVCGYSQVYYAEKNGVNVGFMGLTEWDYTADEAAKMVADARAQCDLLIVYIHWGDERVYRFGSEQRSLGERLVDAGADLVVGNHSHVYGEIYKYKGKYIIYSLGNFCFGGNRNPDDKRCIIFRQSFKVAEDGSVQDIGIDIIPASVSGHSNTNDYQPCVMDVGEGTKLLKAVAKISNLTAEDTIWMDSSYEVQNNIITSD